MVNGAQVYLRNTHPERAIALPLSNGRCRVLAPGVTTAVPAAAVEIPTVARLLEIQAITLVSTASGSISWNASARQAWADRSEMEARIHRAEQREFAALLCGLPTYHKPRRPEDRTSSPYTLLKAAAASAGMAPATLRAVLNGQIALPASLKILVVPAKPASPEQKTPTALHSVHWRRRNDLAAVLFEAVQRKHRLADPVAAATWLVATAADQLPKHWAPAQDALLRQRWAEGASIAQLAAEFDVTRGAVLGRARRLELPRRHG